MKNKKCPLTTKQIRNRIKWERDLCNSVKARGVLARKSDRLWGYCCLGRACAVLGVSNKAMNDRFNPKDVGIDMLEQFGILDIVTYKLAGFNDSSESDETNDENVGFEMSHEEISLFLSIEREAYQAGDLEIMAEQIWHYSAS